MASSGPGNTDRGWNDPPMFDYQGTIVTPGSLQHTKLNKRVAYPMTSNNLIMPTGTATLLNPSEGPPRLPPVQILPPAATTTTPTPIPLVVPTLSPTADPCGDSIFQPAIFSPTAATIPGVARPRTGSQSEVRVKDLPSLLAELSLESEEALLVFVRDGLNAVADSVKETLQGRALEEVKKKLSIMNEWWISGKISHTVKSQMGSLVEALNKQEVEKAHEMHLALMINHTTEVNQWLVAVKHLVQELRSRATCAQTACGLSASQTDLEVEDPTTHQKVSLLMPEATDVTREQPDHTQPASDPAQDEATTLLTTDRAELQQKPEVCDEKIALENNSCHNQTTEGIS